MRPISIFPLLVPLALGSPAWAQDTGAEPGEAAPPAITPVEANSSPRLADQDNVLDAKEGAEGVTFERTATLDDSIPLPKGSVHQAGPAGDQQLENAKGDPYFLGFAAGSHYPAEAELVDPQLQQLDFAPKDLRPEPMTYGFVMFSKRITEARLDELRGLGARVLGFHPHYTMKVAMPMDRIGDISTLDFVRWVGQAQPWQKFHPELESFSAQYLGTDKVPVYVSVFESDLNRSSTSTPVGMVSLANGEAGEQVLEDAQSSLPRRLQTNGWMHQELLTLGADVVDYFDAIDVFTVLIAKDQLDELASRDFVQFLEPIITPETAAAPVHDESRAMIQSDTIANTYDGGFNSRAIVGIQDSGVENSHQDLSIWGVGWNCTTESSPWDDLSNGGDGHGTHVAGTILGRGVAEADARGNASGLATWGGASRMYNVRRFPNPCSLTLDQIHNIFATPFDDGVNVTERPHVVNNSWGTPLSGNPIGSETNARSIDTAVINNGQMHVYAAGNEGSGAGTLRIEAAAKNAFTVGNIVDYVSPSVGDPGNLWTSSSRGPAGDNRWKPNVVAPGRIIRSALANDNDGYAGYSGTSMAAPHVTAAVAQLVDHYSFFAGYQPARVAAHLMATAMTKNNISIATSSNAHLDTYGAGRIQGYKAHNGATGWSWLNWGYTQAPSNWNFGNFTLPAGTTRMVVVVHYLDPAASAGASSALVNNYDLYLDQDPIDPDGDTGEWFAQQSSIDNTELRILDNPQAGPWRWKLWPESATTSVQVGLTVFYTTDDTTPDANLQLSASDNCVQPGESVDVSALVDPVSYVASGVVLDRSGSFNTLLAATTTLQDGVVTDLTDNVSGGDDIVLGDIYHNLPRTGTWRVSYGSEGVKTFSVQARSDNMLNQSASVQVTVDGTAPGTVGNLQAQNHSINVWSNDATIEHTWNAASDGLSGIKGYGINLANGAPADVLDIGPVTTFQSGPWPSSTTGRFFAIKSVDNCDNWDTDFVVRGPYLIDVDAPSNATFQSSTHPLGAERCANTLTVSWNAAVDPHSGVQGYRTVWSQNPTQVPSAVVDTTATSETVTLANGSWYLHVRTRDVAGNWTSGGATAHFGPFHIVENCGTAYCNNAVPNSTGLAGQISASGSEIRSENDLTLLATSLPSGQFGYFLNAQSAGFIANPGGSQGNLCLGNGPGRYDRPGEVKATGGGNSISLVLDLGDTPTPGGPVSIAAGETWFFQCWYRDANPIATSNFTNGVRVTFN